MVIGKSWIIAEDQPLVNNTLKVINLNLDKLEQGLLKNETVWLVAHDEYDGI